jgi:hypothetical protein
MKYAVLDSSGIVTNIIIAASLQIAVTVTSQNCVVATSCSIGDYWDGSSFIKPGEAGYPEPEAGIE